MVAPPLRVRRQNRVQVGLELGPVVEERDEVGVAALLIYNPRILGVELAQRERDRVLELVLVLYVVLEQVLPTLTRVLLESGRRVVEAIEAARDCVEEFDALALEHVGEANDLVSWRFEVGPRDHLR